MTLSNSYFTSNNFSGKEAWVELQACAVAAVVNTVAATTAAGSGYGRVRMIDVLQKC